MIFLLGLPSLISLGTWSMLYLGDRLQGAEFAFICAAVLSIFLPVYTIVLIVQEWRSMHRVQAKQHQLPIWLIVLLVCICTAVSELFLWLGLLDWVEAIASV